MQRIETETSLRRFQLMGFASVAVIIGLFGGWAALASINGAVIAPATVAVETSTKRIQHKEGGIVRQLLVKDGDRVGAGQPLVVLDDTEFRAEFVIVEALLVEALAKRARLEAQRDRLPEISFPAEVLARAGIPAVAKIVSDQAKLFQASRASLAARRQQFEEQIGQLGEQIAGYRAQQTSKERQIALLDDELAGLRRLLADGLVQVTRVLAMERERARLEGERGELVSARAGAESKIAEVRIQMSELDDRDRTETLAELRDAGARAAELSERRRSAASKVERSVIRAPVAGDVYQIMVHTVGGVIAPGDTLMLLVPEGDELVLQAQVAPHDIDQIKTGQAAHVRFPAFDSRTTPEIGAEVDQVAGDTSRADAQSPPFYGVRLRIPRDQLEKLGPNRLRPGMPAEAFIETGERSPLSYFLKPLTDQIAHTFREG